jgi:hypothetical protein
MRNIQFQVCVNMSLYNKSCWHSWNVATSFVAIMQCKLEGTLKFLSLYIAIARQ